METLSNDRSGADFTVRMVVATARNRPIAPAMKVAIHTMQERTVAWFKSLETSAFGSTSIRVSFRLGIASGRNRLRSGSISE
jgi:membrane-bound lytic murein transglycosylase MltF